jgi:hypothetical protein
MRTALVERFDAAAVRRPLGLLRHLPRVVPAPRPPVPSTHAHTHNGHMHTNTDVFIHALNAYLVSGVATRWGGAGAGSPVGACDGTGAARLTVLLLLVLLLVLVVMAVCVLR